MAARVKQYVIVPDEWGERTLFRFAHPDDRYPMAVTDNQEVIDLLEALGVKTFDGPHPYDAEVVD